MALVVFLKGINVGGHRTFRPRLLANDMAGLRVTNIGAAGTFVVRKPVGRMKLRAELRRRLPFDAEVMICGGDAILRLVEADPFAGLPAGPDIVRFVSVLARRRPALSLVPLSIPDEREWSVRIIDSRDQFVLGVYRRNMKAIGCLGQLEKVVGVPVTTRNWNTILAVARVLQGS